MKKIRSNFKRSPQIKFLDICEFLNFTSAAFKLKATNSIYLEWEIEFDSKLQFPQAQAWCEQNLLVSHYRMNGNRKHQWFYKKHQSEQPKEMGSWTFCLHFKFVKTNRESTKLNKPVNWNEVPQQIYDSLRQILIWMEYTHQKKKRAPHEIIMFNMKQKGISHSQNFCVFIFC